MRTMKFLSSILRQCGLAKDIRCNEMGDTSYRFGWLKSGGKGSLMRRMLSSMMSIAPDTPDVAASGATTQWANGPTAPPRKSRTQNKLRHDALNGSIGSLDMATLCIGSLADKNMYLGKRNPHESPWNCRY